MWDTAEAMKMRVQQAALSEATDRNTKMLTRGGLGAAAGATLGLAGSNMYGKLTKRENIKRDLISALGGTVLGGVAGISSAANSMRPKQNV